MSATAQEAFEKYYDQLDPYGPNRGTQQVFIDGFNAACAQLAALKEEVKILTAENELLEDRVSELEAREIDAIANKICGRIPPGYYIKLYLEKEAGWVELYCPGIGGDMFEGNIYSQLVCALEVAEDLSKEPTNEGGRDAS